MTRGDAADLRVRRRLAQIEDRLSELRARSHEVSEPPPSPGLDRERLLRAAGHARQARARAAEAAQLALAAYIRSAQVHDRVADLYDQLLAAGTGDLTRYRQEAERHRMLAGKDRNAAANQRKGTAQSGVCDPGEFVLDDRVAETG